MKTDHFLLLVVCFLLIFVMITSSDASLEYDYYRESCPQVDQIIRSSLRRIYDQNSTVAPAILRLVFHDCFVQGCDASVLLDPTEVMKSEKDMVPNQSLRGFEHLDLIKSELETACPGVVSCADLLVIAARDSVSLVGGPFYPVHTGRKDSNSSYPQISNGLPGPSDDLATSIGKFTSKGFTEKETVTLLGAHSTGMIQCQFFEDRLHNFNKTNQPDPTLDPEFAEHLRSICNSDHPHSQSPSASPSPSPSQSPSPSPSTLTTSKIRQEKAMKMDYEGSGSGFGTLYYRSLLQGRGILFVDQQLTAGDVTVDWVRRYASDISMFHRDFSIVMMKLSNTQVLTGSEGEVRQNCRKASSPSWQAAP